MFSIVVCSNRPERALAVRRHYESLFLGCESEIVVIDDAASLCEGYTRGLKRTRGDFLVFSHDDVEFVTHDVAKRLAQSLAVFDMVGIAGTTRLIGGAWNDAGDPHCYALVIYPQADGMYSVRFCGAGPLCVAGVQALDGCFIACRREVAERVGFDASTFDGFHLYDLDFTFGAYLAGYRLAVCRDLALIHQSLGRPDETWQVYRDRFEAKYRGRLAQGDKRDVKVANATVRREQLPELCNPDYLVRAVRWS
jgi:GT2 family glycosyltransferase